MPTLVNVWSTANWQERECFDLLGVLFEGHPDLRRLLLPDDWEGHPLRKDFEEKEDYHGIPTVRPNPIELFKITLPKAKAGEVMSEVIFTNEMDEEMTLNMGPHHPSTHGVLRFIIQTDGEIIRKAMPDVGYLHRSIEKIGERCTYPGLHALHRPRRLRRRDVRQRVLGDGVREAHGHRGAASAPSTCASSRASSTASPAT